MRLHSPVLPLPARSRPRKLTRAALILVGASLGDRGCNDTTQPQDDLPEILPGEMLPLAETVRLRLAGTYLFRAVNPANGEAGQDRATFARTPWSVGIGALLRREWPIDVRLRYSRSSLDWIISQDSLRLDYRYNTGALSISVGVGISS